MTTTEETAPAAPPAEPPKPEPVDLTSYFTEAQIRQFLAGIRPNRVRQKQGQSHLEAYDIRAHLNRCLGFARWDGEVLDCELMFEEIDGPPKTEGPEKNGRPTWIDKRSITVAYRVRYRLVVKAPDGTELARYTEEAMGDAANFPGAKRMGAHDFALKTAESQALKRCAINLGDQFGLSLYAKGSTGPVVGGTFVHVEVAPVTAATPAAQTIDAGMAAVVEEVAPEHADLPTGESVDTTTGEVSAPPVDRPTQARAVERVGAKLDDLQSSVQPAPTAAVPGSTVKVEVDPAAVARAVTRIQAGTTEEQLDEVIAKLAEVGWLDVDSGVESYTLGDLAQGRIDVLKDEARRNRPASTTPPAVEKPPIDIGHGDDPADMVRETARRKAVINTLEKDLGHGPDEIAQVFGRAREKVGTARLHALMVHLQKQQVERSRQADPAAARAANDERRAAEARQREQVA